jgi:beta-lactamase superfamily II metal-dependent hydrolase
LLVALLLAAPPARAADAPWVIDFLDVGQGDSSLLRLPDGNNVLIDAGTPDAADTVVTALRARGVKSLDMVIMTHPHADHVGGVHKVLQAFPTRLVLDAGVNHPIHAYERILKDVEEMGIALKLGRPGLAKRYGPVSLEVLAPSGPLLKHTRSDVNNASIITRWRWNDVTLLQTGDAEQEELNQLMKTRTELSATILKVPHHGSRYTCNKAFLDRVKPKLAVISCAKVNDYHHPHKQAVARLRQAGARLLVTADVGTVTVTTRGLGYDVKTERDE